VAKKKIFKIPSYSNEIIKAVRTFKTSNELDDCQKSVWLKSAATGVKIY